MYQKEQQVFEMKQGGISVAERVRKKIESNVYWDKAIELGIANYSAIAEQLKKEVGGSFDAVKIAVARYAQERKPSEESIERVKRILDRTSLTLKTNSAIMIFYNTSPALARVQKLFEDEVKVYSVVNSPSVIVVIVDDAQAGKALKIMGQENLVKKHSNANLLLLNSPTEIETTPGIIAFLLEKLAENNINVIEIYSCYTDTAILISREDALKAFETIEKHLRPH